MNHGRYLLFDWPAARPQSARANAAVRRGGPATFTTPVTPNGTSHLSATRGSGCPVGTLFAGLSQLVRCDSPRHTHFETAFFTRAVTFLSSAGPILRIANEVGHMSPSSRFEIGSKPMVQ